MYSNLSNDSYIFNPFKQMNKLFIFIACMVMSIMQGYAQCDYVANQATISIGTVTNCSVITGLSNSNQTISARDQVILRAGFSISNTWGHSLTIKTDNAIATSGVSSTSQVQASDRTSLNTTNYIPGTVQGSIDVSPSGSVSYSIPIMVSPGSHGMQPQLSINYASQSGRGEFGYGWHLGGLSKIEITSEDVYNDLTCLPTTRADRDYFELDGQRLIPTGSNDTTYSLQNDPYTIVTGSQYTGFTVTSPNGVVTEYGKTPDSFFGDVTFSFGINKVTDANGNFMEYNYYSDEDKNEYRIREINYTGNGSIKPNNSVKFFYAATTDTNTIHHLPSWSGYIKNNCITSIKVFSDEAL